MAVLSWAISTMAWATIALGGLRLKQSLQKRWHQRLRHRMLAYIYMQELYMFLDFEAYIREHTHLKLFRSCAPSREAVLLRGTVFSLNAVPLRSTVLLKCNATVRSCAPSRSRAPWSQYTSTYISCISIWIQHIYIYICIFIHVYIYVSHTCTHTFVAFQAQCVYIFFFCLRHVLTITGCWFCDSGFCNYLWFWILQLFAILFCED